MADNEFKAKKDTSNFPIYRSKKTNKENTYNARTGLQVSDDVRKVLGNDGVSKIGKDIGIGENKISTGGGDPLPKGSHDNEFLVAENAEEAEEMRERTNGETPVRVLQYRDKDGQFAETPEEVSSKIKDKTDENKDYLREASGLSEEEFEKRIKSIGMTKDEFIEECTRAIDRASKSSVERKTLMKHLVEVKGLKHEQALRVYDEGKYGRKDTTFNSTTPDNRYKDFLVKFYQIMNENAQKAKRRGPIKMKMRRILKENKEKHLKKQQNQNENQNTDNLDKVRNEATNVKKGINLSQYSQQEINQAKEEAKKYGGNPNDEMELEYRINQNRKDRGQ